MTKVFIVDDHFMVIEGIRVLLDNEKEIELIGYASNVSSCKAFLKSKQPDVLLLDINLPDGNGIDLCKELRKQYPHVFILALTTFNQESYIKEMMDNGASGYLLKNASKSELKNAILQVAKGKIYLNFDVAQTLKTAKQETNTKEIIIGKREQEVLQLIAGGLTNNEIAEKLLISSNTVDTYRKSLLIKLNAKNSAELVKIAINNKLIE